MIMELSDCWKLRSELFSLESKYQLCGCNLYHRLFLFFLTASHKCTTLMSLCSELLAPAYNLAVTSATVLTEKVSRNNIKLISVRKMRDTEPNPASSRVIIPRAGIFAKSAS